MTVTDSVSGLEAADKYYKEYGLRARELKKQGRKIIGYLCALAPVELITAAGFVPFRIKGSVSEPITKADTQMETIVCPLVRSAFDITIKGNYEFLDGLVVPHACDSIVRTYDVWKYNLNLSYSHFVNMPHMDDDSSLEFFTQELKTFRKSLGKFAGKEISDDDLLKAIELHNKNRVKIRELYELRKSDPPLVSGTELSKVLIAAMSLPVEESIELVGSVIAELKARSGSPIKKQPRLVLVGAQVDDVAFIKLVEDSGANVVADDLCPGTREHRSDIAIGKDLIGAIAERYLRKVNCGRTCRYMKDSYPDFLEDRFSQIGQGIKDFKASGAILYIYKYCDPFGFEVPAMKSYIESFGIPALYLEDEYSMATIGRLRTRIQAFLEMLGSG